GSGSPMLQSLQCAVCEMRLRRLAGSTVGRTDSIPQPEITLVAPPQTRPWHEPMPQRDCNFASRQLVKFRNWPKVISSHRHTIVSFVARLFNSYRKAKALASSARTRRPDCLWTTTPRAGSVQP